MSEKPFSYPNFTGGGLLCSECNHSIELHIGGCIHDIGGEGVSLCGCSIPESQLLANMRCLEFRAYVEGGKVFLSLSENSAYHVYKSQEIEYLIRFLQSVIYPANKNPSAVAMGSIKTEKKAMAVRENGKKGGRPKGVCSCPKDAPRRFQSDPVCDMCGRPR